MKYTKDDLALIALNALEGIDEKTRCAIRSGVDAPGDLFENFPLALIKNAKKDVYNSIGRLFTREGVKELVSSYRQRGFVAIPDTSELYPSAFRNMTIPPLCLYAKGNIALLQEKIICVVGSRRTLANIIQHTETIARELSTQLVVLTGVATGGDGAATRGALPSGNVIAMLPGGMLAVPTNPLLEEVARQGLVISPFPPKMPTRKFMYHMRNQMMVCLADAVLVTSAGKVSGAKMTGGFGLEMGKPTYAFPYTVGTETGEGCNELIKNGASLVESAEDIFPDFNLEPLIEEKEEEPLSEEEARVMACFAQAEEVHVETVAEALRVEAYEAGGILTLLETKNKVVRVGGNKYRRV